MKSTGEVMGIDLDFGMAFAKAQLGEGTRLPREGSVFISVRERDKPAILPAAVKLVELGFKLIATRGTAAFFRNAGLPVAVINKVLEGRPHIVDALKNGQVDLLFNTTDGARALADSADIRRTALMREVPYYTTVAGASAAVDAIAALRRGHIDVVPLQDYFHSVY